MTTTLAPTRRTTTDLTPTQRGFLRRVNLTCAWGEGVDGFDLGILAAVLPLIITQLGLSPVEAGLIGASSLIGLFVGAPLVGLLTDRFGRKNLFTIDLILFVVLGGLQGVVNEPWQLFVVRLLLGITIGAEYSLGGAMLAEFVPSHGRGTRVAAMIVWWYVGYLLAVVAGFAMLHFGMSWRMVLASTMLPAILTLLMRIGVPESPRWLVNRGRKKEAQEIVDRLLGADYWRNEEIGGELEKTGGLRAVMRGENGKRLAFCSVLWAANVGPYFAIFTFAPAVMAALGIGNETLGSIIANAMAALGAFIGMLTLERVGRREQVLATFAVTTVALSVIGFWGSAPGAVVVVCFTLFSLFNAAQGNLTVVYPSEIMPTEVRGTGIGFACAVSRLSAAAGTFLLPIGIDTIGIAACMGIGAGVLLIGGIVSYFMAPETTGKTLTQLRQAKVSDAPHQMDNEHKVASV